MAYSINYCAFHDRFERFKAALQEKYHQRTVSFGSGWLHASESYKADIYETGRSHLSCGNWKREDAGSGEILRRVISAVEISVPVENSKKQITNNLVSWDNRRGPSARSHQSLYQALSSTTERFTYESLLYDFYHDELPPRNAFNRLVDLAGKRYDFIAYLFFLKDWTQYLPISPANFNTAFSILDVGLKTSRRCSWDNYESYLNVIRQVRDALRDAGVDETRLIDAHSFCYILAKWDLRPASGSMTAFVPEPLAISGATLNGTKLVATHTTDGDAEVVDFDRLQRERAALGRRAEGIAIDAERERLRRAGHSDLADRIELVAGDHTKGYDIKSFNEDGTDRFIEAKAVRAQGDRISFYLTER